jgi:two-component sensor histidine kinase
MATTMFNSYNVAASQISLDIDASSVTIDIERAVPVSLIVSEMLTNSLKHAFPDRRKGRIAIGLRADGKDVILTFSDNGVGLPASVTFEKTDTLGIGLLAGLTKQLNGTIAVDRTGGTSYTVTFPGKSSEEGE